MDSRKIASFLVVGGLTAILYFGLLALFLEVIKLEYRIAVSIAYGIALLFHFFSNRRFTFLSSENEILPQAARYLVIAGVSYLLTLSIVYIVVDIFRSNAYVGAALSLVATTAFGYLGSIAWVFRNRDQTNG